METRTPLACSLVIGACVARLAAQPCVPGITQPIPFDHWFYVERIIEFHDGNGWGMYMAGVPSGGTLRGLGRWDGQALTNVVGISGDILSAAVFDDGVGSVLCVGGRMGLSPGMGFNGVARWDGHEWSRVGDDFGLSGTVLALASFDDGAGPALYAGGAFPQRLVRWDGDAWQQVPGLLNNSVHALMVHDDGSGPALYVGGRFTRADSFPLPSIGRWDGAQWSAVGEGTNGRVYTMAVFDDGAGPALYISGNFSAPHRHLQRWDGATWSAAGDPNDWADALAVFDDGDGPALYAGGWFTQIGFQHLSFLARYDGQYWSSVNNFTPPAPVTALGVANDGAPALFGASRPAAYGRTHFFRYGCPPPPPLCIPNCDNSSVEPILNIDDFTCFINEFAAAGALPHAQQLVAYANCDASTAAPVLNVDDFTCFINIFASDCP